jgi:tetratricopeptide (TPR) repeat protein
MVERRGLQIAAVNRLATAIAALALAQTLAVAARAQESAGNPRATDPARAAYLASMQGRKAEALEAVEELAARIPVEQLLAEGRSGWALTPQYAVLVRFGLWDELIALTPPPNARAAGLTAGYLYARGVALAARGRLGEARKALVDLERLGTERSAGEGRATDRLAGLIAVAVPVVAARIAATELRNADAIAELGKAAAAEDQLSGSEEAGWFFQVRDLLGAQLLIAGRPAEAERVYREDLARHGANGWALYGLAAALRAQGRKAAAAATEREFIRAWEHADVRLLSSAFWFAGPDTTSCECQRQAAY